MRFFTTINMRKTSQILFFLLFLLTVFQATYPFKPIIPPELFLWFDPLTAVATQIAGRFFNIYFLLSFIILLSPFFIGRAFCGWVCPLGTLIDTSDHIIAPKKNKSTRRYRPYKSILLVFFLILAILGVQYTWFMDPLPILWRSIGVIGMAFLFLIVDNFFSGLTAIGFFPDTIYNIQDGLSAYLFPVSTPNFASLLGPIILILIILGLSKISRRFWCRNLCPLGALLGLLSKLSPLQRVVDTKTCTECSLCNKQCKMDAIEENFITTEKSECIFCLNCADACAINATRFRFQPFTRMQSSIDISKRSFIGAGAAAIIGAGLFHISKPDPHSTNRVIRPPGSVEENRFLERCIRCEECVRICSTAGNCLQMSLLESGLEGLWTPVAKYRYGYCEYNCNLCGQICPTRAIKPLPLEKKQKTIMGTAIFLKNRCIPYRLNENCNVCEEHCPTPEKAIKYEKKPVTNTLTKQTEWVNYPYIETKLCIGCGICENKCPLDGEAGVIVIREGEERL